MQWASSRSRATHRPLQVRRHHHAQLTYRRPRRRERRPPGRLAVWIHPRVAHTLSHEHASLVIGCCRGTSPWIRSRRDLQIRGSDPRRGSPLSPLGTLAQRLNWARGHEKGAGRGDRAPGRPGGRGRAGRPQDGSKAGHGGPVASGGSGGVSGPSSGGERRATSATRCANVVTRGASRAVDPRLTRGGKTRSSEPIDWILKDPVLAPSTAEPRRQVQIVGHVNRSTVNRRRRERSATPRRARA